VVVTRRRRPPPVDSGHSLVRRSHHDRPEIPDAVAVTGVIDGRLAMHYFDSRGVHWLYSVGGSLGEWRFWRDDPGSSQRFTGTFSDDGDTLTSRGQLSRDGVTWDDDLALTYRRVP
jgi:hypothetical protein